LTTAHYYTPSGRLIQRPWDETFDEYLSYTQREQDVNKPHNPSDLKHTDAGRTVYGGGGIEPDKYIACPIEGFGFNPTPFGRMLFTRQAFENYAQRFTAVGDTRIAQQATGRRTVSPDFVVDDQMLAEFRDQLKTDRVKIDEDAFKKDLEFIKAMLRFRIEEAVFSFADAQRHLLGVDPQAQLGMSSFGEAQRLLAMNKTSSKVAH
jgi:carboxyl-terminal processing protease